MVNISAICGGVGGMRCIKQLAAEFQVPSWPNGRRARFSVDSCACHTGIIASLRGVPGETLEMANNFFQSKFEIDDSHPLTTLQVALLSDYGRGVADSCRRDTAFWLGDGDIVLYESVDLLCTRPLRAAISDLQLVLAGRTALEIGGPSHTLFGPGGLKLYGAFSQLATPNSVARGFRTRGF